MKLRRILIALAATAVTASAQTSGYDAAHEAFDNYQFDLAEELLDKYASKRKRDQIAADQIEDPYRTGVTFDRVDELRRRIDLGRNMLERVEKLVIVDSLTVDRYDFFRHFRLDPSSGRLADATTVDGISADVAENALDPIYVTEDGETMMWVSSDDDDDTPAGTFTLMETERLADGSWEKPRKLFDRATIFADDIPGQLYSPFIMADGVTLYFAADGPQSLGGLDIFIARRESDGSFLQPSNIGMPYNSPANDFMMAIDEATGAGWWATDRNTDDEHVTIYIFKPQELRVNFENDADNLAAYAMLREFEPTDAETISSVKNAINSISKAISDKEEFRFAMPDGKVIKHKSDFRSPDARELIDDWSGLKHKIDKNTQRLLALRNGRSKGDHTNDAEIKSLERTINNDKINLKQLANDIIRSEQR